MHVKALLKCALSLVCWHTSQQRMTKITAKVTGTCSCHAVMFDDRSKVVLTASGTKRGKKMLGLKEIVDKAISMTKESGDFKVKTCLVFDHPAVPKGKCPWVKGRDLWWQEQVSKQKPDCKVGQVYFTLPALRLCVRRQ